MFFLKVNVLELKENINLFFYCFSAKFNSGITTSLIISFHEFGLYFEPLFCAGHVDAIQQHQVR